MKTVLIEVARRLAEAHRGGPLLAPLGEGEGANSIAEAYEVQEATVAATGLPCGGWKIGCTSDVSQRNLGSDGPIVGRLFAERIFESGVVLTDVRMDMLLVEAEFAFRMGSNLPARASAYLEEEVADAVSTLHPAVELVQSRFTESRMPIIGIVTDQAGAGSLILGEPVADWRAHDLAAQQVCLRGPSGVLASGHGWDVLGHPLTALTWAANFLSQRGIGLGAGEVVTTGTCFAPAKLEADITVVADFGGLGRCEVRFKAPTARNSVVR